MSQDYYKQHKHLPIIFAILALVAWVIILSPYPTPVFMSGAIACMMLPAYRWLRARMGKGLSVLIFALLLASCIIVPLAFISVMVAPQAIAGFRMLNEWRLSGWEISPQITDAINSAREWLMRIPGLSDTIEELTANLNTIVNDAVKNIVSGSIGFAGSTVNAIWIVVLFVFLTVLAVVYAPTLRKITLRITQLPEDVLGRFVVHMRSAIKAVFIGIIFVALIQGTLCGIGYWLVGISQPAFWGMLTAVAAIIPVFGTALVWVPIALVLWLQGDHLSAIAMVAWGAILVSNIDNLIRPVLLKTGINAPMFVLFLAIILSLTVFGTSGLVIGPLLVAFAIWAMQESDIALNKLKNRP